MWRALQPVGKMDTAGITPAGFLEAEAHELNPGS